MAERDFPTPDTGEPHGDDLPAGLEARFAAILEGPDSSHEGLVAALCREFPHHAGRLWRWLAVARRLSQEELRERALAFDAGQPTRIGSYRIVRKLGQGGMGTVYEAEHAELGRRVAVKTLRADLLDSATAHERFRREVQAVSRLDHPGICRVYEVGEDSGIPFMSMQLLHGEDLDRVVRRARESRPGRAATWVDVESHEGGEGGGGAATGRRGLEAVLQVFEKTAAALQAAHDAGVVHRDVKPGNIMLTRDGQPVILDFGLVQEESARTGVSRLTTDPVGTVDFMSPEQVRPDGGAIDRRTDVYSLGVSLFQALTLRVPFPAGSRQEAFERIQNDAPPRVDALNRAVPRDLAVVVAKAIDKDPGRRYQTAASFAEDLRRVRCFEPIRARPASTALRLRRWIRRNPLPTLLIATVSAGLALALSLLGARQTALDNFDRLAVGSLLRRAKDRAAELHPAWPANEDALRAWIDELGRPLARRLDDLRGTLAGLRAAALPYTEEQRARDRATHPDAAELRALRLLRGSLVEEIAGIEAAPAAERAARLEPARARLRTCEADIERLRARVDMRRTYELADDAEQFLHDVLAGLERELEEFLDPERGVLADVEDRLRWAGGVEQASIVGPAAAWRDASDALRASDDVRASRLYRGRPIDAQVGLVPLGIDPDTKLLEFAHLRSGEPAERDPRTGRLRIEGDTGIVFVLIPGATFRMGAQSADPAAANFDRYADSTETPPHAVTLAPFFLSKYEMTQGQWKRLSRGGVPSQYAAGTSPAGTAITWTHPVEQVTWTECRELLRRDGLMIPTEAQWEYACRAGTPWWTGPTRETLAGAVNLADATALDAGMPYNAAADWPELRDGYAFHAPVDTLRANPFGLHHVHGNILEWCRDGFEPYSVAAADGDGFREAPGSFGTPYAIVRGGSFVNPAPSCRSSARTHASRNENYFALGVRPSRPVRE